MNYWVYVGLDSSQKYIALCKDRGVDKESTLLALEAASLVFDVDKYAITSKCRLKNVAEARHCYCAILYRHTRLSLKGIALPIGRNHATVLNSVKVTANLCDIDKDFKEKVDKAMSIYENLKNKKDAAHNGHRLHRIKN